MTAEVKSQDKTKVILKEGAYYKVKKVNKDDIEVYTGSKSATHKVTTDQYTVASIQPKDKVTVTKWNKKGDEYTIKAILPNGNFKVSWWGKEYTVESNYVAKTTPTKS